MVTAPGTLLSRVRHLRPDLWFAVFSSKVGRRIILRIAIVGGLVNGRNGQLGPVLRSSHT